MGSFRFDTLRRLRTIRLRHLHFTVLLSQSSLTANFYAGAAMRNLCSIHSSFSLFSLMPFGLFIILISNTFRGSIHLSRWQDKTLMKLVVDAKTDKVPGTSMYRPDAPTIVQVPLVFLHVLFDSFYSVGMVLLHLSGSGYESYDLHSFILMSILLNSNIS
ncbi:hypothetical protein Dimus_008790 [Dionaea muscipula]